jgi:chemotaxis signal transduction protein
VQGVEEYSGWEGKKGKARQIEYRGRKVPFLDLAEWFGGEPEGSGPKSLLILGKSGSLAAAGVDSPGKVETVEALEEWPSLFRPLVKGMFTGLMVGEEGLVLIVDPEGVMEEVGRRGERITQGGRGE